MSSKPNEEPEKTPSTEQPAQTPPEPEKKRKTSIFRDPYVKVE